MTSPFTASRASDLDAAVMNHLNHDGSRKSADFPVSTVSLSCNVLLIVNFQKLSTINAVPPPYDETSPATSTRKVSVQFDRDSVAMFPPAKTTSGARLDAYLWDAAFGGTLGVQPRVQAVNGINFYSKKDSLTGKSRK